MTADQLTAIRARLDALAEVEAQATRGPWRTKGHPTGPPIVAGAWDVIVYDEGAPGEEDAAAIVALRNAAPALLALAEAAVRLVAAHRWPDGGGEHYIQCVGCGGHAWRPTMIAHATDCPAVAVDAALAALADAPGVARFVYVTGAGDARLAE